MQLSQQFATRFYGILYGVAAAALVCASCDPATAQRRQREPRVVELKRYNVEGTVVAVRPGWIQCADSEGTRHAIQLHDEVTQRVVVTGTAEPHVVQPGMFVRFTTPLSRRGRATQPIDELTLVAPRAGLAPGVFRDDPRDPDGSYLVMGQIRSIRRGKVTLEAANQKVEFEVTESPQINVDLADYSLARPGDTIKVQAIGQNPNEKVALNVEIELSQPLGFTADTKEPEQNTPRSRRSSRRDRRTAQEQGAPKS